MKDSTLDRVKFAKIHFYDWERHAPYDMTYDLTPRQHSDYYDFWFDGRAMVNPMMQRDSFLLYDEQQQIIPLDQYDYTWNEIPFDDGDGGAFLEIRRKNAA